jgi:predicted nucleic acid-binding protein
MIAVADTSPLNYLVLIDEIELLPILFERILAPHEVLRELAHPRASLKVREWTEHPPAWLQVEAVRGSTANHQLIGLDAGEREAIQPAFEANIGTVLIDEAQGRSVAQALGLEVRGTLAILERAARLGKIDFRRALGKLSQTSFRISTEVQQAFLAPNLKAL